MSRLAMEYVFSPFCPPTPSADLLAHGDMKAGNQLLTRERAVRICDFGRACHVIGRYDSPATPP